MPSSGLLMLPPSVEAAEEEEAAAEEEMGRMPCKSVGGSGGQLALPRDKACAAHERAGVARDNSERRLSTMLLCTSILSEHSQGGVFTTPIRLAFITFVLYETSQERNGNLL